MGDRANCVVHQNRWSDDRSPVWLYTHWTGSELPSIVQRALKRRQRWDDQSYLTRIIFDEMTAGHQGEETGFGISTSIGDNEHPLVVVDPKTQEVRFEAEGTHSVLVKWTFEQFCAADLSDETLSHALAEAS